MPKCATSGRARTSQHAMRSVRPGAGLCGAGSTAGGLARVFESRPGTRRLRQPPGQAPSAERTANSGNGHQRGPRPQRTARDHGHGLPSPRGAFDAVAACRSRSRCSRPSTQRAAHDCTPTSAPAPTPSHRAGTCRRGTRPGRGLLQRCHALDNGERDHVDLHRPSRLRLPRASGGPTSSPAAGRRGH